jgi:rhamnose transport system ATP-binding protein
MASFRTTDGPGNQGATFVNATDPDVVPGGSPGNRHAANRPHITLKDVSRSFGNTHAVRGVTLDLATAGVMHALVGENGAGKSTCLGLGAGRLAPSRGSVIVDGSEMRTASPRAFIAAGVHAIYQELTIVPALSPSANVFLGKEVTRAGWLRKENMQQIFDEYCARVGVTVPKTRESRTLPIAQQQVLEILRALTADSKAILLDEPTASLGERERDALFTTLDGLRRDGIALTLVSHNLDEVLTHCDRVTVFRDGGVVEARPARDWSKRELVSAMLGSAKTNIDLSLSVQRARGAASKTDAARKTVLSVKHLSSPNRLHDITFDLRQGEILGVAGLVGSGRTELLRALAGLDSSARGSVETGPGESTSVPSSVRAARRRGIALLPEDRKGQGLVLGRSAADNVTLGELGGVAKAGFVSARGIERRAKSSAVPVGFDPERIGLPAGSFSGGNQQKLMLARWLHAEHPILLADEPTRGVDVGAKADILRSLESMVEDGRSLIVVSSDLEEVVGLSERVLVLSQGKLVGILDSADDEITVEAILRIAFHSEQLQNSRSAW